MEQFPRNGSTAVNPHESAEVAATIAAEAQQVFGDSDPLASRSNEGDAAANRVEQDAALLKGLTIRALNGDNHKEAAKLVDLFRRHYGSFHPYRRVYDPAFWCSSRQSQLEPGALISIVAEKDNRFIAHLALDRNRRANSVQILLPAIEPALRKQLFAIIRAFWQVIEQQGRRQKWGIIFEYNLSTQPLLQMLAAKCFNSETTALIPCPHISFDSEFQTTAAANDTAAEGSCIQVMVTQLHPLNGQPASVFVPTAHRKMIEDLYAAAGIQRRIVPAPIGKGSAGIDTSRRGLRVRALRRLGVYQIRVAPSDLSSWDDCYRLLQKAEHRSESLTQRPSVQINLNDPLCPEFCTALEKQNYRFCGILPMMAKSDYIVYARYSDPELEQLTLYSPVAKALRDYMLSHTRAV